jgi:AcrR family transcriptional regulator
VRTKTPLQAEKILAVAARFFATHRFHEARMEDIAAAAEVGKGTLYRYFKDKDELFSALLAQAADQLTARLNEGTRQAAAPRQRLEAIVAAIIVYFDEHPHLFDLIQHTEVMHRIDETSPWGQTREYLYRLVRGAFAEAGASGAFVIDDPELALLMLMGSLRLVVRFGPRPRPADLPARIVEYFLTGAAHPLAWQARRRPVAAW